MRRIRQALSAQETREILERNTNGVLSLATKDGIPYGVPISYVYDGNDIYFHCARQGLKMDLIRENPLASFCVIDQDEIVPEKFTTFFKSAMVMGVIHELEDPEEIRSALTLLAKKYSPSIPEEKMAVEIEGGLKRTAVLKLIPDAMSGKQAKELMMASLNES